MLNLTWEQVAAWRVQRHYLVQRAPAGSLLAVASRICGLHAQLMSSAEMSAWARVEHLKRGDVQGALWKDKSLVKTWAMRGTLHLLPAAELPVWHAALSTSRRQYLRPGAMKYYGLKPGDLARLTEAIGEALEDRILTREELAREVARRAKSRTIGESLVLGSWGTVMKPAAFTGRLCFAPNAGARTRYTRPDTWLGTRMQPEEPQAALHAIARRYLAAYGPATAHELARWWGHGRISAARQWIAALGEEVAEVELDGKQTWMLSSHAREAREIPRKRCVRLLPAFDPYVVGASPHAEHLLPGDFRRRIYRPQGWISPVLLVNGRMDGTWRHDARANQVEVTIRPFVTAPQWVRRAAALEAERLAAFLGGKLKLAWKQ